MIRSLILGAILGAVVTCWILVQGSLAQGAILNASTWPIFVVVGAPLALLGAILGMLVIGLVWLAIS